MQYALKNISTKQIIQQRIRKILQISRNNSYIQYKYCYTRRAARANDAIARLLTFEISISNGVVFRTPSGTVVFLLSSSSEYYVISHGE